MKEPIEVSTLLNSPVELVESPFPDHKNFVTEQSEEKDKSNINTPFQSIYEVEGQSQLSEYRRHLIREALVDQYPPSQQLSPQLKKNWEFSGINLSVLNESLKGADQRS